MNNTQIFLNVSLSHHCIQILLGGLLGDGSLKIQKRYRNARYQIRHSITQKEYIEWKHRLLKEVALPKLQIQKPDGFSIAEKISLFTKAHKELTTIHSAVCKNNKLVVERSWLDALDELALLVWWLDDGSLVAGRRQGCFCTDGFPLETVELLQGYLADVWKINAKISTRDDTKIKGRKQKAYYRLYLSNSELRKLFDLIMPYLEVETMVQKFALVYNDLDYKQRWICTMKKAMPCSMHKAIDMWYA